jgi:tRNA(Ile)-lysidine synthase
MICRDAMAQVRGSATDLETVHIRALAELFEKRPGKRLNLPGGLIARREDGGVWLTMAQSQAEEAGFLAGTEIDAALQAENPGRNGAQVAEESPGILRVTGRDEYEKILENSCTKCFDYDKIDGYVIFRHRQPGDYITIAPTGKKSIRRFMIDQKIPREKRDSIWLLADGSHILWIVGYRVSEYYKVNDQTKRILEASI